MLHFIVNDFCGVAGEVCTPSSALVINHDACAYKLNQKKPRPLSPNGKNVAKLATSPGLCEALRVAIEMKTSLQVTLTLIKLPLYISKYLQFIFMFALNEITFKRTTIL